METLTPSINPIRFKGNYNFSGGVINFMQRPLYALF